MAIVSAEKLIDSIESERTDRDDTVYCNSKHKSVIIDRVASNAGMVGSTVDDVRVAGLRVEHLPRIERPIVCRKGDVFPLAKDWKNAGVE